MSVVADQVKGGGFILKPANKSEIFMPESMTEEQAMVVKSTKDFIKNEIKPVMKRIEAKEAGLAESIFLKMGELGLLGAHMPVQYGGSELDANTIALMLTVIGDMGSFNTPYAAHTGIGMLPILYFGTEAQKEKYLPPMISGELIASYCLTEPTSGSDALSAKTQAVYNADEKSYVLNGQKMWISNAGYAGIFIVFAQVDGDKFTAFIIPREAEGLTLGAEEEKLGIHGSSTRQVFLENVKVPEDAVLGEIGKGHQIAFNVLNMGRFKLGALCACGAKYCLNISTEYAKQRVQFGTPIASFGAIQEKLAWMAVRTAALQSATFRISSQLTKMIEALKKDGMDPGMAKLAAAKEFAVECSIIKVAGSEAIDFIADETVQVFGGMGYSEEAEPAQIYRDARINRIYEGTNEINRLLIVDQLFKKGMKGELPLMQVLMSGLEAPDVEDYSREAHAIREVIVKLLGYVGRRQMSDGLDLEKEQEVTMALSDIGIAQYMLESLWLRKEGRKALGLDDGEAWEAMYNLQAVRSIQNTQIAAFKVLSRLFMGEELQEKSMKIMAMAGMPDVDLVELQRTVASKVIDKDGRLF